MASGIDNLLDALKQSGMNVDDIGSEGQSAASEGAPSDGGSGSGRRSRSRGDMPFGGGGFPFTAFGGGRGNGGDGGDEPPTVEFASSLGDRMASWTSSI